ncbi:hypothetical protein SPLC1_S600070 [Arthrospira platensis C1]|nr:hypothetical protein SPLC1_S600070 [Arthrospira platensis C1]
MIDWWFNVAIACHLYQKGLIIFDGRNNRIVEGIRRGISQLIQKREIVNTDATNNGGKPLAS